MSTAFEAPPTPSQWNPVKLVRESRNCRQRMRELGLLTGELSDLAGVDLEADARRLMKALSSGTEYRPTIREQQRFGTLTMWMYEKGWNAELQQIRTAVCAGRVEPVLHGWWLLLSLYYTDAVLCRRLQEVVGRWPRASRDRLRRRMGGLSVEDSQRLPDALADSAVSGTSTLGTVTKDLKLLPGSPLDGAVWSRLLSVRAAPWVANHTMADLTAFLKRHQGHDPVGYIGRQLLEPLRRAGLTPAQVGVGTDLARLVELIAQHLPRSEGASAWRCLGKEAAEVIRWWRTQRDLEKFFGKWNALADRERFWRGYVRHIEKILAFERASALAMFVNGYWYVEFGNLNNACWRYSDRDWKRLRISQSNVWTESDLKKEPRDYKGHYSGWQTKFPDWIGQRPS